MYDIEVQSENDSRLYPAGENQGDARSRPGAVSSWPTSRRRCATSSPRPMGTQTTAR